MTLIDRLSKLDGPDREVDADIDRSFGLNVDVGAFSGPWTLYPDKELYKETDRYTASVDAAIALAERVLSGWTFENIGQDYIRSMGVNDYLMPIGWTVEVTDGRAVIQGQAPTFPLAICIAILRAKETGNAK